MTKPKYATQEERRAAQAAAAKENMKRLWAERREADNSELGYFGAHRRVRKERGRAGDLICECGRPAHDWAHIHDTDPNDPMNYVAMCKRCHTAYDHIREQIVAKMGHERWSAAAYKAWETKRARAAAMVDPLSGPR